MSRIIKSKVSSAKLVYVIDDLWNNRALFNISRRLHSTLNNTGAPSLVDMV